MEQTKVEQPKACEVCGKPISEGVAWYSLRQYGTESCIACQLRIKRGEFDKD